MMAKTKPSYWAVLLICAVPYLQAAPLQNAAADPSVEMRRQMHELDKVSVHLMSMPQVVKARKEAEDMCRKDRNGSNADALKVLEGSLSELAYNAAQVAANEDPANPRVQWVFARAHEWQGLKIPGGRWAVENPDNVYYLLPIDGVSKYEIIGKLPASPPAALTMSLWDDVPTVTTKMTTIGILKLEDIKADSEGRFVITIDSDPANGRPNHIQSNSKARMMLIRNTLTDWSRQLPVPMFIKRIGGPAAPSPKSMEQLANRTAELIIKSTEVWPLDFQHYSYEETPINTLGPIINSGRRGGGGLVAQMSAHGSYKLADDEALIVRLNPYGAKYLGFELSDLWMVSTDYVDHSGSLNHAQVVPDADGKITYVISVQDPGVYNWADPGGLHAGSITVRYQGVPADVPEQLDPIEARVVKLSALRAALPAGTRYVNAAERRKQQEQRVQSYRRRVDAMLGSAPTGK